jgi:ABC-type bacteriocin/lantibiotic exporter with double-glycine peptidase domain
MSSDRANAPRRARAGGEVPFTPQLTPTDCGAASLASVLAFHGKHVPMHELRAALGGGRNGVNARQILAVARNHGLQARGVAIDPDKLRYLPRASILHWDLAHFLVFERCDGKFVELVDPSVGRRKLPQSEIGQSLSGVALVFEPGPGFVKQERPRRDRLRRYREWMFGIRGVWGRILIASFALQLLALATPGLMGIVVDKVVPRGDGRLLYLIAAACLTASSFYFLSQLLRARLLLELRTKVEARMSFAFVDHLLDLPYAFFQQRSTGDLMMRMSSQAAIRELLTSGALSALLDGALVAVYFALLLGAAPLLAACAFGFALLQGIAYLAAARRSSRLVMEGLAAQARLEAYQIELLASVETLKSMGAIDRSSQRWGDLYVSSLNRVVARGMLDGTFEAVLSVLRFGGPISLMLIGAHQVLQGNLSLGVMLSLSALGAGFLEPIANLIGTAMHLTQLRGYMERIEDVLDAPRESPPARPGASARTPDDRAAAVSVQGLAFAYPSEPRPVLTDIGFEVAAGECVAIVGASGSGKSTLARLLAGLYEPLSGSIAIDGRELRAWDLHALRERFGIVTQETRLFSATLRDNVALFDPDVAEERIERACRLACLHDTIAQMPMGYDTMLADGGSSLSGGQRQRLSLARALLREPALLILDEATSSLDTATERNVHEQLRALPCTRIVVAHRLSTVVEADKIVVLETGRIAGIGTHAQLLASCPAYRELVRAQAAMPGPGANAGASAGAAPVQTLHAVAARPAKPPQRSEPSPRGGGAIALSASLRAAAARGRAAAQGSTLASPVRPAPARVIGRAE